MGFIFCVVVAVVVSQQSEIDHLFVDLRTEAVYLNEDFTINWVSKKGLVENIDQVVEEYKLSRGLLVND